jgi:adenylate kinase family enzyme
MLAPMLAIILCVRMIFVHMVRELLMERIVIIGSSGAGKSTLAKKLGPILKIKVFHLDRFFWRRRWKRETSDTRIDILQDFVREKRWIIEGSYLSSSELRLNAADTIIFLDTPPLLCLQRIMKRHREYHGRSRRDIPEGCTDKLTLLHMLKVLTFPLYGRRKIKKKLRNYKSKQIIRLRSGKEVEGFLAQQKQGGDEKNPRVIASEVYERM